MKRTVRAVVLAVAVMAMVVPAVSADGGGSRGADVQVRREKSLSVVMPPSSPRPDRPVPRGRIGSVLVPLVFTYDGTRTCRSRVPLGRPVA